MSEPARGSVPVLLFDGDCGFCRRSARRLEHHVGDAVQIVPYQEVDLAGLHSRLRAEACRSAVQLVEADGRLSAAAEASLRALSRAPGLGFLRVLYRLPGIRPVSEALYRNVAGHRGVAMRLLSLLSGNDPSPGSYRIARSVCLVLLGIAAWITFSELGIGTSKLLGSAGIVPLEHALRWEQYPQPQGFLTMPSLLWWWRDDLALHILLLLGVLGAVLQLTQRFARAGLCVLFVVGLSFLSTALPPPGETVENPFVGFTADALLVEMAFLGLLLVGRRGERVPGSAVFLFRLLLLRVVFFDALGHIQDGGTWSGTDAFVHHLVSQACPSRLAIFVAQGPAWVAAALRMGMVACSTVLVFLVFGPRRLRALGALAVLLHVFWVTALETRGPWFLLVLGCTALCIDDQTFARVLRRPPITVPKLLRKSRARFVSRTVLVGALLVCALVQAFPATDVLGLRAAITPWFFCNDYRGWGEALSAHPTVVLEGSTDGQHFERFDPWYAPGELERAPALATLAVPRFDMRLEIAARTLAAGDEPPAFLLSTIAALLERRGVTRLLFRRGRFENEPPRFVRLRLRPYHAADAADRRASGLWWYNDPDAQNARLYTLQDGVLVQLGR